jgi:hypothetical protein
MLLNNNVKVLSELWGLLRPLSACQAAVVAVGCQEHVKLCRASLLEESSFGLQGSDS